MRRFIVFPIRAGLIRAGLRDVACKPAKKISHGRPPSKYPDDLVLAVLVDWLRGVKRAEILRKHDIGEASLTNWTTNGNRRHLLLQAERLVPLHERARGDT